MPKPIPAIPSAMFLLVPMVQHELSPVVLDSVSKSGADPAPSGLRIRLTIQESLMRIISSALLVIATTIMVDPAAAEQIGEIGTDWTGNDIVVEAITDPDVAGVTCHLTYFSRGLIDRLSKGNWFEDPSNSSIACRQTGPIVIGDIDLDENGEEVFKAGLSLIWKSLVVNRIYDKKNDTLIYLIHSREVVDGSAKMAI
jgi:CreA protein